MKFGLITSFLFKPRRNTVSLPSERTDAGRFTEGVSFKGKLIGVLEVTEARGDRMCQEALADLKIAVRAAGEHKQRIAISVAMDGIRLTDERTGVSFLSQ